MTTDRTPSNRNFLSPNGFKFLIKRNPYLEFFIQKINAPGIINPTIETQTPFTNIPQTGDHLNFEPLIMQFKVDEDLNNYWSLHNWIRGHAFDQKFEQYAALSTIRQETGEGLRSDVSLIIFNNLRNVNFELTFIDAFPYDLSNIEFDTTNQELDYLNATVKFAYTYYTIARI